MSEREWESEVIQKQQAETIFVVVNLQAVRTLSKQSLHIARRASKRWTTSLRGGTGVSASEDNGQRLGQGRKRNSTRGGEEAQRYDDSDDDD